MTDLDEAIRGLLALEWQHETAMSGADNLFCPWCGGCPGSAARNPRSQRPDGHRIGRYIRNGHVVEDGCPAAAAFDAAREAPDDA